MDSKNHWHGAAGGASGSKAMPLLGGVLLGWMGTWVFFTLVAFSGVADVDSSNHQVVTFVVSLGAVPLVAVVLLLLGRSRRQLGVGLLLGLAIGSIVGSGVCATWITGGT